MYSLKIIQHAEVTKVELDTIVKIKAVAWPYPYDEQLNWIDNNLDKDDFHVLLMLNSEEPVAYLNLVNKKIQVNGNKFDTYGIGNVCSVESGKGFGTLLMKEVTNYILKKNRVGILFCKKKLVSFYTKFGWIEKKILKEDTTTIISMVFNLPVTNNAEVLYEDLKF